MFTCPITCLVVATTLVAQADAPKEDAVASIVGVWNSMDRHVAVGSLFQPVHGVRKREAVVMFRQEAGRLTGFAVMADHKAISFQERWQEGRTDFRNVQFADNKLTFEFAIAEWRTSAGPIAIEDRRQDNTGTIRVEARLHGQRLVGKWGMFLKDGTEVFRGEWEATRVAAKQPPGGAESTTGASTGTVMLIGGRHQDLSAPLRDLFFELAGGTKARIVIIPTGVANPESQTPDAFLTPPANRKPSSMRMLHTRDRKTADDPEFVKPLAEATAVFITNGHLHRLTDVYPGTLVEKELKKLLARGGVVGGTGIGATILGSLVINRPHMDQLTGPGLGLLPKFVYLDDDTERGRPGLVHGLTSHPDHVGLTIDSGTAVVCRGNQIRIVGAGKVDLRLAEGGGKKAKLDVLPASAVLDLVELRREAARRAQK